MHLPTLLAALALSAGAILLHGLLQDEEITSVTAPIIAAEIPHAPVKPDAAPPLAPRDGTRARLGARLDEVLARLDVLTRRLDALEVEVTAASVRPAETVVVRHADDPDVLANGTVDDFEARYDAMMRRKRDAAMSKRIERSLDRLPVEMSAQERNSVVRETLAFRARADQLGPQIGASPSAEERRALERLGRAFDDRIHDSVRSPDAHLVVNLLRGYAVPSLIQGQQ